MAEHHRLPAAEAFARIGRIKFGETGLDDVLQIVADLAKATVPGADEVSVTLVRDTRATTAARTGELALALDEAQYGHGDGPCLDAAAGITTLVTPDTTADRRWPGWARRAADAGVLSALAVGLPVDDGVTGALNIYATAPAAFDRDAVVLAQTFAGYAAVTLANAHVYDLQSVLVRQVQAAMTSRAVIEQAKGILMRDHRCTPDEAFRILTAASRESNRKLRDVAAALVAGTASR
ncbi:ANTAR domain-containing protein [Actinoplanes sp. NPDC049599]|uniref:ANTAR domain-containing protein n=1 Tax=Actinoplanes sp. NPDC049599 TaxID=3363903 RepID=UPI0037B280D7